MNWDILVGLLEMTEQESDVRLQLWVHVNPELH